MAATARYPAIPGKPRLLVLNPTCLDVVEEHRAWIEAQGVELLAEQALRTLRLEELDARLAGVHAVILPAAVRNAPHASHLQKCRGTLQVLSIAASGFDFVDLAAAQACGVAVTNVVGGVAAEVVADMALALLLAVSRQIPYHQRVVEAGGSERRIGPCAWGKTIGIVGLGHIGKAVARRARGFDMKVLACSRHDESAYARTQGIELVSLPQLLQESDFVSLHLRLSAANERLIGPEQLALMKKSAFLINTARRELVDEKALEQAILTGRLAGAALDDPPADPRSPLLGLPNVIFTPHLGNRAAEGVHGVFQSAVENALAVLRGETPATLLTASASRAASASPRPQTT